MLGRRGAMAIVAAVFAASPALGAGPSCFDGVMNGPESDVDCGGDCPACEYGDRCMRARDCTSGRCEDGECAENLYTPGEPLPAGYRVEIAEHDAAANVRKIGFVGFGVSYAVAYTAALSLPQKMSWMFAPVVGPWLSLGNADDDGLKILIVVDGVLQAAGAAFIVGGVAGRGHRLERTEQQQAVRVVPHIRRDSWGISLGSVF